MITNVGQIMLYVNNQDEAVNFWTEKLGFRVIAEEDNGQGFRWIEVAPDGVATSIVLHNKEFVAKMEPDMNLGTPSLMFFTQDLNQLHTDLTNKNVKVGEIVSLPNNARVFNFSDDEDNYFAVTEKK
ncbi:VOC family protein [Paenibacillus sp. FSL W7-1287]|uniref:VOC family protein n=1 Tax=Paenibacillus sp. FSL W7-1287 TaxID=2954538 RepID=UPI0030FCDBB6